MNPITFIHFFNDCRLDSNVISNIKNTMQKESSHKIDFLTLKSSILFQRKSKCTDNHIKISRDEVSGLAIINNSRVDNRKCLIDRLKEKKDITDDELILKLYLKYGEESFKLIEGSFAFIIFNDSNGKIIAARDFFGQNSLYYFINDNFFIISSRISPLLQSGLIKKKSLNSKKILEFLFQEFQKDEQTIYKEVFKLKGGYFLTIENKNLSQNEYFNFNKKPIFFSNKKEAIEALKEIFTKIITEQSSHFNGSISSTLSGGLDSSSIASVLSSIDEERHQLHTISSHFVGLTEKEANLTNESSFINDVLNKIDSNNTRLLLCYDKHGPIHDVKRNWITSEIPCGIINGYMHAQLYQQVRKINNEVIFDGLFGDEVISHGTNKLYEDILQFNLPNYFREVWFLKKNKMLGSMKNKILHDIFKPIYNYLVNLKKTKKKPGLYFSLNNFSQIIKANENTLKFLNTYKNSRMQKFNSDYEEQIKLYESGIIEHSIEQLNQLAIINNINLAFPFLDKRIVETCLRIPVKYKIEKGFTRIHFKEALKDFLPQSIYKRQSKANISPFARNQLNNCYGKYLEDITKNKELQKIINMSELRKLYEKGISAYFLYVLFFNLISLHLWINNNNMTIE